MWLCIKHFSWSLSRGTFWITVLDSSSCRKHTYWCCSTKLQQIMSSIDHTSVTVLNKTMVNKPETSIMFFLFQFGGRPSWFIFFSCIRLKHAYCKGGKRVMRLATQLPSSMSFLRLLHFNICIKEFYTHLNPQATKTLVLTAFIVFWVLFSSSV